MEVKHEHDLITAVSQSCKVCVNLVRGVAIMFTSTVRVGKRSSDLTERLANDDDLG
jgi:hypothetical protein